MDASIYISHFELETERLRIRPLTQADEPLWCDLYTDAAIMHFIGPLLSRDRAKRSFRRALALAHDRGADRLFLVVTDKIAPHPLGVCGFSDLDPNRRQAEVGIILRSDAQARGVAQEALSALTGHAFAILPIDRLSARIASGHAIAERVLIGIGFSQTGVQAAEAGFSRQAIWSAFRHSWRHRSAIL
ncbi:MAG: GNAT family N-acetyltransferase [Steroidobacter sp.]